MAKCARVPVVLVVASVLAVAACGGSGTAPPPSAPAASAGESAAPASAAPSGSAPSPTATVGAIDHPTGAGDVVLRASTRGGFVRLETVISRMPEFTLYGDGRALILPEGADTLGGGGGLNPGAAGSGPVASPTLREVRLTEDEVQALLTYAITDGHLGTARDAYLGGIMDAPSTVFEINAGGVDRSILVTGLTPDPEPGPDAAAIKAFATLVSKLRSIGTTDDYRADGVEAVIAETEPAPGVALHDWPWTDLAPADFPQPPDDAAVPFPSRLLDAAQGDAVASQMSGGGAIDNVRGPDGKAYLLLLRPALPEEVAGG